MLFSVFHLQASLVKMAMCFFALENFVKAHSTLEKAVALSRDKCVNLSDHRQFAEILNNLGCLSYMSGEIGNALQLFRESIEVQTVGSENSLYLGSKFACHSASLNLSVSKANIGFIALATRNITVSVTELESAMQVSHLDFNIVMSVIMNRESHCFPFFRMPDL
jgi:tetratricopeptide (TPR) repeat protein